MNLHYLLHVVTHVYVLSCIDTGSIHCTAQLPYDETTKRLIAAVERGTRILPTIMATEEHQAGDLDSIYLFHQLDGYPWDEDQEFQGGLRAILGSVQDPAQVDHLTLRAKCYFYARKAGTHVDFDGYKRWVEGGHGEPLAESSIVPDRHGNSVLEHPHDGAGAGGMADAPKPASFAEICDMIAEGKPIPGIKDIPDTILEGQASESQSQSRKKPWERAPATLADASAEKPSWLR